MQYTVICREGGQNLYSAIRLLEERVESLCTGGWKPQGGISITCTDGGWFYACQAMVKD